MINKNNRLIDEDCEYVVKNENTLGYFIDGNKKIMGVLESNKNGHNWLNGSVGVCASDKIRPATKKDFDTFNVYYPTVFCKRDAENGNGN